MTIVNTQTLNFNAEYFVRILLNKKQIKFKNILLEKKNLSLF